MRVREGMSTPPVVAAERLSAPGAPRLMEERNVRRLPVLDDEGRGDLLETLGPYPLSWRRLNLKVADVMARRRWARTSPWSARWRGLPAVEGGRPLGIVTESDLFRALCRAFGVPKAAQGKSGVTSPVAESSAA